MLALTARLVASFPELKALFATDAGDRSRLSRVLPAAQSGGAAARGARRLTERCSRARTRPPQAVTTPGSDRWRVRRSRRVVQIRGPAVSRRGGARRCRRQRLRPGRRGDPGRRCVRRGAAGKRRRTKCCCCRTAACWRPRCAARRRRGARATSGAAPAARPDRSTGVDIGVQRFAAREVVLADQPALSAVILKSRDEAIEPFRRIQNGIVLIGLLCAAWRRPAASGSRARRRAQAIQERLRV